MLRRMSARFVDWQIERRTLPEDDKELYLYAYEVLLNQVINVVVAVIIAVVLRAPVPVFVFLVGYIPLRSYGGGYHADSNFGCNVVSAFLICAVCLIARSIEGTLASYLSLVFFVVSGFLIFKAAPVPDKNKPLDEVEIIRYRLRSRVIWAVEAAIGTVMVLCRWEIGIVLAISHMFFSLMLCLGLLKNRPQRH